VGRKEDEPASKKAGFQLRMIVRFFSDLEAAKTWLASEAF